MKKEVKILINVLSGAALAIGGFIVGNLVETKKIKAIYNEAKTIAADIEESRKDLAHREEIGDVKYSFCRCIAQNMKEKGYKINFLPEHSFDISPAVERDYAYGVAIAAIGDSDMDPYHKETAIVNLRKDEDPDYYQAVIEIADNNNTRSTDKMQTILNL